MMTLQQFLKKRPYLLWYVKEPEQASEEAAVEAVLNYGDMDDVRQLISILGIKKVASIFKRQLKQKRVNYDPKISHFFKLYFKKHA